MNHLCLPIGMTRLREGNPLSSEVGGRIVRFAPRHPVTLKGVAMTRELLLVVRMTHQLLVRLIAGNVVLLVINAVMFVVNAINMRGERRLRKAWQGLE